MHKKRIDPLLIYLIISTIFIIAIVFLLITRPISFKASVIEDRAPIATQTTGDLKTSAAQIPNLKFIEFVYLEAYPDVAQAVKEGLISSGEWHYENFGKAEGRLERAEYVQAFIKAFE